MRLIEEILAGVDNDRRLRNRREGRSPLGDLIASYEDLSGVDDRLVKLNEETTIGEFKDYLQRVPANKLIVLLYNYSRDTDVIGNPWDYNEHPRERDNRNLRHWMIKTALVFALGGVIAVIGAAIALGVRHGDIDKGPLVGTFLDTAVEILKLIFSSDIKTE